MRKSVFSRSLLTGAALLALCVCWGCKGTEHNADQDSSKPENKVTIEQRIKEIDSNTHMPEQAKAAAKAALLSHQNQGK